MIIPKNIHLIAPEAFKDCLTITTLVTQGELYINEEAFSGCVNLREIRFEGKSVINIRKDAFKGCTGIEKIVLSDNAEVDWNGLYDALPNAACNYFNGGYYIGTEKKPHYVLKKCDESMTERDIHGDTEEICFYAFKACRSLAKVSIPKKIKSIDRWFYGCQSLRQVILHQGVKEISDRAFEKCSSLENITIPGKVQKISIETFCDCLSLTTIVLPKNLTYIGERAFANCTSLKEIYIPETVKTIRSNAFEGCVSLTIVSKGGDYAERFAKKNKITYKRI